MKSLIACYSHSGKTLTVAEKLQKEINADFTRIEPVKDRWYLIKAIHAYLEKKWPIKPCTTDIDDYDCLIVCCPIWAGRTTPGVIQYLDELVNTSGKKFAVLVTMGGDGNQLATIQIRNGLEAKEMEFIDKLIIGGSAQKSGEWETMTKEFAQKLINEN
ncbi:MAG: flavodoxin [Euryarchaeota archaeon]|jgi:flavodoxin|uniref:flavodoxin family protein n=1 Tax=Methanobacterium sp. MZD130B TaxID=3394378 RepID=UPI001767C276|nr:flavodoxin [Euryarchaeota archaeon]HHT19752.1 flavodoxin [Methanobacterium sp.]